MPQNQIRDSHSFVLRLWIDTDTDQDNWRGQLECVGSQEKTYFRDVKGLLEAVAQWMPAFDSNQTQSISKEVQS